MRKNVVIILVLMMLLSLSGCGLSTLSSNDTVTEQSGTSQVEISNGTSVELPTSSLEKTSEDIKDEITNDDEKEITFTELVAVDNEECTITISSIEPDNMWGYTLKARLENKSTDKTYMFSIDTASINGVVCDPFFASVVAAGKKANEGINFNTDELKENGITEFTDIEIAFRVYDANDWTADEVAEETVHVYPYGEENAVKFVREAKPTDNVIIDNEFVTVVVTGYEVDKLWGYTVNLFLVNKTESNVMFSVDETSVNGFMADPFYATDVSAGNCAFSSMSWSDSTFEENDITEVETIEFRFRAYDADDWFSNDFANEVITLNP